MKPTDHFLRWLEQVPGPWRIGQVRIGAGYVLTHADEDAGAVLNPVRSLEELRQVIKTDSQGNFRPLRGAPTLQRGWRMEVSTFPGLMEALEVIYPTAVALWTQSDSGTVSVTPYRETFERQTGMYRITASLSSLAVAELVRDVCAAGCLRQRLWEPKVEELILEPSHIPLLCVEACNFFIGKAREKIKGTPAGD